MPSSLTTAVAAAVLAALLLLGRRRQPLIRDADTSAVAALNRAQIALMQSGVGAPTAATLAGLAGTATKGLQGACSPESPGFPSRRERPTTLELPERRATHEVLRFRATLRTLYNQGGASRLEAVQAARHWGDSSTLPLLRQALRDPDPAVVREAAAAIHRFRGRPSSATKAASQPAAAPRRVARTR